MIGKTIKIFLVDGTATGVLSAEISNWTGKLLVCPRSQLDKLAEREEAARTGVYALVGPDPEQVLRERVYIGESDNVFGRLKQQQRDPGKDFWTRTVLVTSKDENLTKAHGLYLESQMITRALAAGRAAISNTQAKEDRKLPESDVADMETFLAQLELVLPVLGFNFMQAVPQATAPQGSDVSPEFVMTRRGVLARAQEINGEFIVRKGSTARRDVKEWFTSYRSLWQSLVDEAKLVLPDGSEFRVFTDDVAFTSPSAAAAIVNGGNANGREEWKVDGSGLTYAQWQVQRLEQAEAGNGPA